MWMWLYACDPWSCKREGGPTLRDAVHDLSGNFESGRQAGREGGRKVDGHFWRSWVSAFPKNENQEEANRTGPSRVSSMSVQGRRRGRLLRRRQLAVKLTHHIALALASSRCAALADAASPVVVRRLHLGGNHHLWTTLGCGCRRSTRSWHRPSAPRSERWRGSHRVWPVVRACDWVTAPG